LITSAPPQITGTVISRQQGATGTVSTIANVNDAEDTAGSLSVEVTSVPAGITISGLTNTGGTITANVAAACNATLGPKTVGLRVTDSGSLTATANLTVNVVDNIAPALTLKPNATPFPNDHKYRNFTMADMVASVSDGCNASLGIGSVVIEKVTSDEPDDAFSLSPNPT
jgi:hypothetical protein